VAQIGALAVLVFGLANLVSMRVSMGWANFLSMRSQNDLYKQRHAEQIRASPASWCEGHGCWRNCYSTRAIAGTSSDTGNCLPPSAAEARSNVLRGIWHGKQPRCQPALNGLMTFLSFCGLGAVPLSLFCAGSRPTPHFALPVAHNLAGTDGAGFCCAGIATRGTGCCAAVAETVAVGRSLAAVVAMAWGLALVGAGDAVPPVSRTIPLLPRPHSGGAPLQRRS